MSGPTVVPFTGNNVNDVPEGLRNLAELLEVGADESSPGIAGSRVLVWVNVDEHGAVACGALGRCVDGLHAAGILSAGISSLLSGK